MSRFHRKTEQEATGLNYGTELQLINTKEISVN